MKYIKQYIVFFLLIFLSSCTSEKSFVISIKNHSENIRETTSVVIPLSEINSRTSKEFSSIGFKNVNSGKIYSSQLVDENSDGENESVLFQPTVGANAEEKFEVVFSSEGCDVEKSTAVAYSRFVRERIDDFNKNAEEDKQNLVKLQKQFRTIQYELTIKNNELTTLKIEVAKFETRKEDLEKEIRIEAPNITITKVTHCNSDETREQIETLKRQLNIIGGID